MAGTEVVKSVCGLCLGGCGVLVTLKDGKPVEIQGDPESPPNKGGLCKIGRAALEYLYNPDRLKHPLKRVGDRGAGEWQQISWDEALALTAEALNKAKKDNGPESVLMVHGSAKPAFIDTHLVRLANAFGTPNVLCADHVCHIPRMLAPEFINLPIHTFSCITNDGEDLESRNIQSMLNLDGLNGTTISPDNLLWPGVATRLRRAFI